MPTYPRTIENGSGEILTFLGIVRNQTGDRLEAEAHAQPAAGPPMHVHHLQEEGMTVVTGKLGYQIVGGPERDAGPGETAVFAPGVAHRWWNAGTSELHCTGWVKPPLNVEYFLTALFDSTKRNGRGRPAISDAAFLVTRYGSEYGLLTIPSLVRRLTFPIIVALGRTLGKYERFRDAPKPIAE